MFFIGTATAGSTQASDNSSTKSGAVALYAPQAVWAFIAASVLGAIVGL